MTRHMGVPSWGQRHRNMFTLCLPGNYLLTRIVLVLSLT